MLNNFTVFRKLLSILSRKEIFQLTRLQILVAFMAFTEVMGIAAFGPFLQLSGNPELVFDETSPYSYIYNLSSLNDPKDFTVVFGFLVLILFAIATIFSTLTIRFLLHYAQQLGASFSSSLYEYYMNQSWLFHANNNSSNLMNKVNTECTRVTLGIIYPLMMLNARLVLALAIVSLLAITDPLITIIGIVSFSSIYFLIFYVVRSRLHKKGEIITKLQTYRFKLMNEGFGSIRDSILLGKSKVFSSEYKDASAMHGRANGSIATMNEVPKYWVELVAFCTMIVLVLILLFQNQGNLLLILPKLGVFAMASYKLLPAFQQVYANATYIKSSAPALDNIYEDMKSWSVLDKQNFYSTPNDESRLKFSESLTLSNINFCYPNKDKNAIENVSLSILPNQLIGFVGESGSGKSTLADLLIGLIAQDTGEILIDGINLSRSNLRCWQNDVGYVPQSIFLADASIAENIAFGVKYEEIDFNQINEVLELSNLSETVDNLTDGLNTIIGERGVQLSGGQRQRIAIARALYNNPSLLVFDEATSALDGLTEKSIMNSINSLSKTKTIIMIAHRLNTVRACDKIFLFSEGKLIDSGNYDELKKNNVQFNKMVDNG